MKRVVEHELVVNIRIYTCCDFYYSRFFINRTNEKVLQFYLYSPYSFTCKEYIKTIFNANKIKSAKDWKAP